MINIVSFIREKYIGKSVFYSWGQKQATVYNPSYDERAAIWHAEERVRLAAQGQVPPYADSQIAAIAKVNDLVLVTRNTADFEMFVNLKVQNWHKSI